MFDYLFSFGRYLKDAAGVVQLKGSWKETRRQDEGDGKSEQCKKITGINSYERDFIRGMKSGFSSSS